MPAVCSSGMLRRRPGGSVWRRSRTACGRSSTPDSRENPSPPAPLPRAGEGRPLDTDRSSFVVSGGGVDSSGLERLQAVIVLGAGVGADARTLLPHVLQAALEPVGTGIVQAHEVHAVVDAEPDEPPFWVEVAGNAQLVVTMVLIGGRSEVVVGAPGHVFGASHDLPARSEETPAPRSFRGSAQL